MAVFQTCSHKSSVFLLADSPVLHCHGYTMMQEFFSHWHSDTSSVQFSHSVVSDSLWPHEPQHARPPCPSPTPRVHPNSCPSSRWCHPANLSSIACLSSCPQSLTPSVFSNESTLHMRWPEYWSFSLSIIPSKEHPGLISLEPKGLSRVFSNTTVKMHQFFGTQLSSQSNSHIHTWPQEKP